MEVDLKSVHVHGFLKQFNTLQMTGLVSAHTDNCDLAGTIAHELIHVGDELRDHPKTSYSDSIAKKPLDVTYDWVYAGGNFVEGLCRGDAQLMIYTNN